MADETVDIRYLLNSDEFARESARIDASIRGTEQATGAAVSQMDRDFTRLSKRIGQIGIAAALVAAGREAYRFSRDLSSKMREVATISEEIEANFDNYKQKIIDLTSTVPVMAGESAAALYQIVSAGHDGADGMSILETAARAAVAGVTETATAADGITSILNAYGKSAEQAESVSDMMFTTVRLGKTTFGELAAYIAQVTPTAAAYGVEMDQVLAAIATLTKSGVPTAQAVTRIRQAIVAGSKVLGDGAYAGRTFQEAMDMIAQKADGSESKLRTLVPEIEAVNGVLGLTGINAETAAIHLDEITRSAGATGKAFEQQMRDSQKQVELLKNNLLRAFSAIGDGILNAVGGLAETLNEAFASGSAERLIAVVGTLVAAYGAWRAQLLVTAAAKRVLEQTHYDEEARQLSTLLTKEQQRALGVSNINKLTRDQAVAVREKIAAEMQALRVAAQLAATEKAAATEAYRVALQRSLAAKEQVGWRQTDLALAKMSGDAAKVEAAQQALAAAEQERHAAAVAKKSAAQTVAAARTKAATTATALNTMQTRVSAATDTAAARAKNMFTAATVRLTRAFKALKVAFASNPIGAIITVITTAATAMALFGDETENAAGGVSAISDALAKHQAEINRESAKIDELFAALKKTKEGTQEYADAKDAIMRGYGSYLSGLDEEVRQLKNVEGAYVAIKNAAIESATARAKAAFVEDAESRAAEKMGQAVSGLREGLENKLSDALKKENPGLVDRLVAELTKIMSRPGMSGAAARVDILKILRGYNHNLNWTDVADISGHGFMWNKNYVDEYIEALQSLEQVRKTAEEVFNAESTGGGGSAPKEAEEVSKRVAALRTDIVAAESELKKLRAPASTATEAQIKQAEERLNGLREQLEVYTGMSTKEMANTLKKQNEISQTLTQAEIDAQSQRVAIMRDGKNKRLAEIDLEYRQTMAKIDKDKADGRGKGATEEQLATYDKLALVAEQKRIHDRIEVEREYAGQTTEIYRQLSDVFLKEEDRKQRAMEQTYQEMRNKAVDDLLAGSIDNSDFISLNQLINRVEEKETAQNQLEKWQRYATERLRIEEDFQQDVARIRKQQRGKEGEDEIEQLREIRDNDLVTLAEEMGMKEDEFTAVVDRVVNMGLEQILGMIPQVQAAIDNLGDDVDPAVKAKMQAELAALKTQAENRKSGTDSSKAAKSSVRDWKDLQQVLNGVAETFTEVGDAVGGTTGEIISAVGNIATSSASMLNGIEAVQTASTGLEVASGYLMIISAGLKIVTDLFSLFSKSHEIPQATIKSYEAYIDVLDKVIDREKAVIESHTGMQAVLASDEAIKAIEKQEAATRDLGKAYLASRAKNKHSYGVKTEERLRGYRDVIEAAGFDWGELYGFGRMEGLFDLSGEEIERFQRELPQVWAQLDDDTRKYLETIVECKDKMDDLGEATNEALTGFTLDDARDELLDFLSDMDATLDDVVDNFQSRMLTAINRVIASQMDGKLKKWYENMATAMEDGTLSNSEREALREEYERIYREARDRQEAAMAIAGINPDIGAASGLRGEISEKITEETATKLEGLFRVTYDRMVEIRSILADTQTDIRSGFSDVAKILAQQYLIEENTRRTADSGERIVDCLEEVYSELKTIKANMKGGIYAK